MPVQKPSQTQRKSYRTVAAIGGATFALGLALLAWSIVSRQSPTTSTLPKVTSPTKLTEVSSNNPRGYVGIDVCQACHAERVKEFKTTRHFLACMPPNPAEMPGAFETGRDKLTTADPHLQFEMARQGSDYVQKTIRTRPDGSPQETTSVVSLVYGQGGIADQVYFGWKDNKLYEFPVARLLPQNQWGASKFDRNGSGDFSREVTPRCLECHNVWFSHTPGTLNEYDRQDMHLGVTCEKCHGPGREHVAHHRANPGAKSAKEIIHPGHLAREAQMAVCGQCHSNAAKYSAQPFTYTPGEPLDKYFKTLHSRYPEDEHVANQDKYLRLSKCYQQSETMTCITCHDPHHREGSGTPARQKTCLKCHQPKKCADRPNLPAAVRDNCIGCHMPLVNKVQVHFFTSDDVYVPPAKRYEHQIGIFPLQRKELLLDWRRMQSDPESKREGKKLEQELAQDWIAKGDELRGAHRFLAAIDAYRQARRIKPDADVKEQLARTIEINSQIDRGWFQAAQEIQKQQFPQAAKTLEKVLELKPDLAQVHGKLGSVYAAMGNKEKAHEHLEAVSQFDPDEPYGESMLGWLAYLDGKNEEAVKHYVLAEEMEPRNSKVKHNRGLALLGLQRWEEAGAAFSKVIEIDPKHSGAHQGLSHALRGQGNKDDALNMALKAAELSRFENLDILLSLADAFADVGRFLEAKNTASRALAMAKASNPQAVPQIVAKIEEFQQRANGSR